MDHPRYALMQTEKESGIPCPCSGNGQLVIKQRIELASCFLFCCPGSPALLLKTNYFYVLYDMALGMGEPKSRETENNILIII